LSGCPFTHKKLESEITFPGFVHTTCVVCFDPFCDKCSGSAKGQCIECISGKEVSDGICIDSIHIPTKETYWFPFLVFSCLWVIFALILKLVCKKKRKIAFIPLALPVVVFISLIMALYDGVSLYSAKGASVAGSITLIVGFVLPFVLQFCYLAFVQFRLTRDQLFQEFR